MVHLTKGSYHATYPFQSESTLCSCLNVKDILAWSRCEIWSLSDCNWTRNQNHLVHIRTPNHLPNWSNDWSVLWVLIHKVNSSVCSYHVTYAFQSESILYSCLNVKELLAERRREIWNLSDWNWTRTPALLVRKRTLNYLAKLAKWLSCVLSTYLYRAFDCMFFSRHAGVSEWIHTLQSPECQETPCSKQARNMKFKATIECGFTLRRVRDKKIQSNVFIMSRNQTTS